MSKFDAIRPFEDEEVNGALKSIAKHPMMKAMMQFTFPGRKEEFWIDKFKEIHSIRDFQTQIIAQTVRQILEKSSEGLSFSGFENLDKNASYLFISNHRDIILDTSLLNLVLLEGGFVMTSSAIGDNLVKKDFLHILAKLNRNFLVERSVSIREQLGSSRLLSEYITTLLQKENRSVWMAQREGRTKDGNDATQQGLLKMLAMASENEPLIGFFKDLKIVPLSISYEYDPTDMLKMPQLMAQSRNEQYVKSKNEDFNTMLSGVLGQKKRIHLHAGSVLGEELDALASPSENKNKLLQSIAQLIDQSIIKNYKLWPTNYIAYDLLRQTNEFENHYAAEEKRLFIRRFEMRLDASSSAVKQSFLAMYANPVINQISL
ncbi:MAG: 1-acyl-sn-glycerol-3-phosphate acyltransferase, partial [Chryseobacterium sp.]|nr:1-acyl-sn-glycerol-3-phosphate acyltransferase [Chryseobacterium sp.]